MSHLTFPQGIAAAASMTVSDLPDALCLLSADTRMQEIHAAVSNRAQVCLDIFERVLVKNDLQIQEFDDMVGRLPKTDADAKCRPCLGPDEDDNKRLISRPFDYRAAFAGTPEIQAAATESPIKRLKVLTHLRAPPLFLADWLVMGAVHLAIDENLPNELRVLLNAETGLQLNPYQLEHSMSKVEYLNISGKSLECLHVLQEQQAMNAQNPQYQERYALEIESIASRLLRVIT